MDSSQSTASLLNLPTELRNSIYLYVFQVDEDAYRYKGEPHVDRTSHTDVRRPSTCPGNEHLCHSSSLSTLLTCRQIHHEAAVLALSQTAFHLTGDTTYPSCFWAKAACLRSTKLTSLRHITLTSRISSLHAMNEAWSGLPFGNSQLRLDTLTIIPTRAQPNGSAYQEVADLSQSHTLAYIFTETLKGLRNVGMVRVMNRGCFNEVVWRLLYRATVYRVWRWGGGKCGIRFECNEDDGGEEWFRVWLKDGEEGSEVGDEVVRLVGISGELPAGADGLDLGT